MLLAHALTMGIIKSNPITFVAGGAAANSATAALPAGWQAGDLLLYVAAGNSSFTAGPAGYTSTISNSPNPQSIYAYKIATSVETNPAATGGGGSVNSVCLAYRYVNAAPFDVASLATANSTTITTTSLTTTVAKDLIISVLMANSNTTAITSTPPNTTVRVSATALGRRGLVIVDEIQAAAGASTPRTFTVSSSNTMKAYALAFKPA